MSEQVRPDECRHRRTTYNERDGTLYCLQCQSWVIPEDSEDSEDGDAAG
jgi:hypothetical protein